MLSIAPKLLKIGSSLSVKIEKSPLSIKTDIFSKPISRKIIFMIILLKFSLVFYNNWKVERKEYNTAIFISCTIFKGPQQNYLPLQFFLIQFFCRLKVRFPFSIVKLSAECEIRFLSIFFARWVFIGANDYFQSQYYV